MKIYRNLITCLLSFFLAFLLPACASRPQPEIAISSEEQNFNLGNHKFSITSNTEAQVAFNRGLTLAYAFSHSAAEKEFRKAATLDPSAAMPWWGVALVNGPHINFPGAILSSAFPAIIVFAQELLPDKIGTVSGLFFGFAFGVSGVASALLGILADKTSIEYVFYLCGYLPLIGLLAILLPRRMANVHA